jgi:predicted peptidase
MPPMLVSKRLILSTALLLTGCHAPRVVTVDSKESPLNVQSAPAQQTAQLFENTNYLLYLPEGYSREKRWPLILYLHGKSLRGNDLEMLKRYGLAALLEKNLSIPFVVVSPQCPSDRYWMAEEETLLRLIDDVSSRYSVDTDRIYVTGHSMGGRGTWFLAYKHPEKFAAVVPLSDAPIDDAWAKQIAKVPAWAFHGTKDDLEPFERTRDFVESLKKLGAEVKFTPLPDRDHYILDTYENKEIYDWLLQHKKR